MKHRLIPLLLAAALLPAGALAQAAPVDPERAEAARREMETLRTQMGELSRRMAELSREMAGEYRQVSAQAMSLRSSLKRPIVGVVLGNDAEGQVQLTGISPDGPAAKAGLHAGDRLLRIDGKPIAGDTPSERLDSARDMLAGLKEGQKVVLAYERDGKAGEATVQAMVMPRVLVLGNGGHARHFTLPGGDEFTVIAPEIDMEIGRIAPFAAACGDDPEDCGIPLLSQAFRWRGLNLAAVDAGLGRYFGTERGVLVLRSGEDLAGLQSGDVILDVDGTAVDTPREAMRALGDKPAGEKIRIEVLRDRKRQSVEIVAPEATRSFRFLLPPEPPAPPAPPKPPKPPAPPAPPALSATQAMPGVVAQIVQGPDAPRPPKPPALPEVF